MRSESPHTPTWQASPEVPPSAQASPKAGISTTRAGLTPWPAELAHLYREAGVWRDRLLPDLLRESARTHERRIALVDNDVRLTYAELVKKADEVGAGLRRAGLLTGDRVVVQLPNRWEQVVTTLGALLAGLVPVWALPEHRFLELAGLVETTSARAVVTLGWHRNENLESVAWDVAAAVDSLRLVVVVGDPQERDSIAFEDIAVPAGGIARPDARDPDDVAILIPSGGTTGMAKVAPRTHNDLAYMALRAGEICAVTEESVYLAVLPLGHGFPNTGPGVLGTLLRGGTAVLCASPTPERAFAVMSAEKVTLTSIVPAIAHTWIEYARAHPQRLPALEVVQIGAARVEVETVQALEQVLGCRVQQVYGMSEGLLCLTRLDDGEQVLSTQGRPISAFDEVLVVDDQDRPLPYGSVGNLLTRGPYTIRGYFASAHLNAAAFTGDGWYRTGDLARLTKDDDVVLAGRRKDVINRGGEKVSAEEIELLCRRLGLGDCAVVGVAHPVLGEEICLYHTQPSPELTVETLRAALAQHGLAAFKAPTRIILVEAIPRTPIGKIDKLALRARHDAALLAHSR